MTITRIFRTVLSLAALIGGLACGSDSGKILLERRCALANPGPGTATVSLTTPNADDGAVLVTLTGPGVSNPQPGSSAYRLYFRVVSADELRVMVVGDLSAGVLLTLGVGAVTSIGQYSGTFVEVASRTDVLRATLTGYSLTFAAQ